MNQSTQIIAGLELMLIGMSTVFVFLSILVILVNLFKYFLAEEAPVSLSTTAEDPIAADEVAAITGAVHQYRQDQIQKTTKASK